MCSVMNTESSRKIPVRAMATWMELMRGTKLDTVSARRRHALQQLAGGDVEISPTTNDATSCPASPGPRRTPGPAPGRGRTWGRPQRGPSRGPHDVQDGIETQDDRSAFCNACCPCSVNSAGLPGPTATRLSGCRYFRSSPEWDIPRWCNIVRNDRGFSGVPPPGEGLRGAPALRRVCGAPPPKRKSPALLLPGTDVPCGLVRSTTPMGLSVKRRSRTPPPGQVF